MIYYEMHGLIVSVVTSGQRCEEAADSLTKIILLGHPGLLRKIQVEQERLPRAHDNWREFDKQRKRRIDKPVGGRLERIIF